MTERWTPGPWHIDEECEGLFNRQCLYVCDVPVARENAHLIAAAPELYEALEGLLENLKYNGGNGVGVLPMKRAKDALSKARGESHD